MILYILGILTLLFTFSAYLQKNRIKFLILNTSAIVTIGMSFYLKGGYVGAFSEFLMFVVHITAIMFNDDIRKRLSIFVPPLIFASYVYLHGTSLCYELIMPIIMSFFVLGAYQTNMIKNKIYFMLGLSLMSIYSFIIGTNLILISNLIGIIILYKTYDELKAEKRNINAYNKAHKG